MTLAVSHMRVLNRLIVFTSSSDACNSIRRKYKRNNSVQSLTLKRTNIHHTSTDTTTYSGQAWRIHGSAISQRWQVNHLPLDHRLINILHISRDKAPFIGRDHLLSLAVLMLSCIRYLKLHSPINSAYGKCRKGQCYQRTTTWFKLTNN